MIIVNDTYGLKVDDYNYTLMKYKTIDPANSVKNKGKNKDEYDSQIRQEWVSENKYYPMSNIGLASALKDIAIVTVNNKLADNESVRLYDYISFLRKEFESIKANVDRAFE